MSEKFIIDSQPLELLKNMAAENGISPQELLQRLIKKEDENRHIIWKPEKGHIRVNCGLDLCKEKSKEKPGYGY